MDRQVEDPGDPNTILNTPTSISAVVVNFNGGQDLVQCLQSLHSQTHRLAEVIVVDNASSDQSAQVAYSTFPEMIPIMNSRNRGFAAAANQGASAAKGEVLFFLNPDVSLAPDCVQRVCEALEHSPGVVGAVVSLEADTDDPYGCTIDRLGYPTGLRSPGEPLYVAGSALATRSDLFQQLGGFDGRYFMFSEDVDYCWRVLLAGFDVTVCPEAHAKHRGGASAAGGYVRSGRLETTTFRFVLRERNALAMLLKCAPVSWLAWLIPTYIGKTAILVGGALAARRLDLARGLIVSLIWNIREAPETFRLRRGIVRTEGGKRIALRRIYRGWLAIERLRHLGMPRFIDDTSHGRDTSQVLKNELDDTLRRGQ